MRARQIHRGCYSPTLGEHLRRLLTRPKNFGKKSQLRRDLGRPPKQLIASMRQTLLPTSEAVWLTLFLAMTYPFKKIELLNPKNKWAFLSIMGKKAYNIVYSEACELYASFKSVLQYRLTCKVFPLHSFICFLCCMHAICLQHQISKKFLRILSLEACV